MHLFTAFLKIISATKVLQFLLEAVYRASNNVASIANQVTCMLLADSSAFIYRLMLSKFTKTTCTLFEGFIYDVRNITKNMFTSRKNVPK